MSWILGASCDDDEEVTHYGPFDTQAEADAFVDKLLDAGMDNILSWTAELADPKFYDK